jgi:hypothetical protein
VYGGWVYSATPPMANLHHEGRLWLPGVVGNRIDASKLNDPFNFQPTLPDGTVAGNNGISHIFAPADVNPIFLMDPHHLRHCLRHTGWKWLVQPPVQTSAHAADDSGASLYQI